MRRSFDGLAMIAEQVMRQNPFAGHLLVFRNRRQDRLKILYWDRDGYAIWYKRLEEGTFLFPYCQADERSMEIGVPDLLAILEGIDLSNVKRRRRYSGKSVQLF
jgi:transposase